MSVIVLFRNAVLTVFVKGASGGSVALRLGGCGSDAKDDKNGAHCLLGCAVGGWSLGGSRGLPTSPLNLASLQPPADP